MTVKQLQKLLKPLPPNMEVTMSLNSDTDLIASVCRENSQVQEAEVGDEIERILFLVPCSCHIETNQIEVVDNPN